jgi:Ala-tRNA(Pro) deacylase
MPDERVYRAIKSLLDENGIDYREVRHAPTRTSEESAKARGEDIAIGGKALVILIDGAFRLFVMSAARKLDSRRLKDRFHVNYSRFATPEELLELTGLVPGCVPPFGRPILPFDLYLDESIFENDRIAFNAGLLTVSIVMEREDYTKLIEPEIFRFSR